LAQYERRTWGESGDERSAEPAILEVRGATSGLLAQLVGLLLTQLYVSWRIEQTIDSSIPRGCVAVTARGHEARVLVFEQRPAPAVTRWMEARDFDAAGLLTLASSRNEFETAINALLSGTVRYATALVEAAAIVAACFGEPTGER
jgi:hypothetical protein